ncbi:BTB/POZ domain-containing protein 3-like [Procambarus clarkii]|uniref:BTB/POZ domain-containing protein 3 n=1 Tax=Procambarus clarkii TaxID=6728 RepID=UPI001E678EC5|nr:BTB/POZ domain-containing protein 3-like [Procambarus clarkii]XP_045604999.1 BTB/POZ domain-containing protein 3-like [Procambarus clarkii]XP_045605000.1 BTB/POZ domain-containing protein 3-like [Procambarus clarkii]XP_045605001.1 BTB/POZ domain-containing protein 3-like [Procambarus clarkii]
MAQSNCNADWQTELRFIHQRAGHVLESGQWADCTFIVGNENNQKTLRGHRLILAMSSPVFEAMFYGGMAEKKDKPVEILDVQPEAFRALLQYIYSDEITLKSFDQVCEICYAAKKYMIPSLVEQCTQFIWQDLHPGNVCRAYEFARLFEESSLLEKCVQIIQNATEQVLKDPSFEEVDASILRTILQQERLGVSELILWEACLTWAKQECVRQSLEVSPMNQRKVLGDCLGMIRFLTLSPTEFANSPAVSGILTQEESYTLLMNISSPGVTSVPSPFCQNNKRRQKEQTPPPSSLTHSDSRASRIREDVQLRCECVGNDMAQVLINEQLVDCSLSFAVNRHVCIYGVEMPTQLVPPNLESQLATHPIQQSYSELIYAFLQDSDGCRLTYTHFTARVSWNSSMEVIFNRPVYITPNKTYKIAVVLNKVGRYPVYVTANYVTIDYLTFTFEQDRSRDGLIKAVIFGCSSQRSSSSPESYWPY